MNKEDISEIRKMLREYYDRVVERDDELKEKRAMYEPIHMDIVSRFTIGPQLFIFVGYEEVAPISIRDELKFIKKELKYWSDLDDEM